MKVCARELVRGSALEVAFTQREFVLCSIRQFFVSEGQSPMRIA